MPVLLHINDPEEVAGLKAVVHEDGKIEEQHRQHRNTKNSSEGVLLMLVEAFD